MPLSQISEFINETLIRASDVLVSRFGKANEVKRKQDRSLVTAADLASEKVILERIRSAFPEDIILSEESGLSSKNRIPGQHLWIVDPLDGTTNFANGYSFFAVSIGRAVYTKDLKMELVAGGVADPLRGQYYLAEKGSGAYCNGKKIQCTQRDQLADAFLCTGFYYTVGDLLQQEIARFGRAAAECQAIRRDGAAALDLALVAAGVYDCFWELGLSVWDLAAGILLIREAGGMVSNYEDGSAHTGGYDIEGRGVVAGSSVVTAQLRKVLFPR